MTLNLRKTSKNTLVQLNTALISVAFSLNAPSDEPQIFFIFLLQFLIDRYQSNITNCGRCVCCNFSCTGRKVRNSPLSVDQVCECVLPALRAERAGDIWLKLWVFRLWLCSGCAHAQTHAQTGWVTGLFLWSADNSVCSGASGARSKCVYVCPCVCVCVFLCWPSCVQEQARLRKG